MRWTTTIAGAEPTRYHPGMRQSEHLLVDGALPLLAKGKKADVLYHSVLQQVVDMPVQAFLPAQVAGKSPP
jgi:hypothetical protein